MGVLIRTGSQPVHIGPTWIVDLKLPLAQIRTKLMAQDRKEPRPEVHAGLEQVSLAPSSQDRFLDEIVSTNRIVDKRERKGSEVWERAQYLLAKGCIPCQRLVLSLPRLELLDQLPEQVGLIPSA